MILNPKQVIHTILSELLSLRNLFSWCLVDQATCTYMYVLYM